MNLEAFFRFKIGDVAEHVATEVFFFITGRRLDECPGGVQVFYACRHVKDSAVAADVFWLYEHELKSSLGIAGCGTQGEGRSSAAY